MTERRIFVIGSGQTAADASAVAERTRGASQLVVVPLAANEIHTCLFDFLDGVDPSRVDLFAAMDSQALNFARFDLWARIRLLGFTCVSLVDPTAKVSRSAKIGENVLVGPAAVVSAGAVLEAGVVLLSHSSIQYESVIGQFSWLAPGVAVGARCTIGQHQVLGVGTYVADDTTIGGAGSISRPGLYRGRIERGTFISPDFADPVRFIARYESKAQ